MQQVTGTAANQISQRLGIDPALANQGLALAVPFLVSALAKNASSPHGADALHTALNNDHDGGILDNVMGFLGNPEAANGAGILGHLLGGQQQNATQGLANQAGLDPDSMGQLLQIAAPLVMGALGKTQQEQGFDPNALAGFLGDQHQTQQQNDPGLMGMLSGLLDSNHDGSVVDDVIGLAGKLFGNR